MSIYTLIAGRKRFDDLRAVAPFCDRIYFYDNENGFVKVAEQIDGVFRYTGDYCPDWINEYNANAWWLIRRGSD